jgi:hypothetical protein
MSFDANLGLEADALPFADFWFMSSPKWRAKPSVAKRAYVDRSAIFDGPKIRDDRGVFSHGAIGCGIGNGSHCIGAQGRGVEFGVVEDHLVGVCVRP